MKILSGTLELPWALQDHVGRLPDFTQGPQAARRESFGTTLGLLSASLGTPQHAFCMPQAPLSAHRAGPKLVFHSTGVFFP